MIERPTHVDFTFPATSPHAGMPLGNGVFGALLWFGEDPNRLLVTINRQDYWQRGPGIRVQPGASYDAVCGWIRRGGPIQGGAPQLVDLAEPGAPTPTRLPMGRFELVLTQPADRPRIELASGVAILNQHHAAVVVRDRPVCMIRGGIREMRPVPSCSDEVVAYRRRSGMSEPQLFEDGDLRGWVQVGIDGSAMCAAAIVTREGAAITSVIGNAPGEARTAARDLLGDLPSFDAADGAVEAFYAEWWKRGARVSISDRRTQVLFDLGMFKLSGLTQPDAPAPTLQGPWVEDDRMPPWGADYHFNVNVQMCHWPMLGGNQLHCFQPLARMLAGWMPAMREYARTFAGISDGLMLPHATDDRCVPAGRNVRCMFDPASTAWTGLLLWDLWRYGGDRDVLRDVTWPLLRGSLRVYEAVFERHGPSAVMPMLPNPEYFPSIDPATMPPAGSDSADWGENASFQLACLHRLIRASARAVEILKIDEPRLAAWQRMAEVLPRACIENGRIVLFRGQDLLGSHRHHSHLAGIYPFDVFDLDGADASLVRESLRWWVQKGSGAWSGWSMSWAAILWARMHNAVAVGAMLENYARFFTGPNHATRHDAQADGFTIVRRNPHIMQIDAAMGTVAAILEALAHERGGKVHLAPAAPETWGDIEFENLLLPGGRIASGVRRDGRWTSLEVGDARFQV